MVFSSIVFLNFFFPTLLFCYFIVPKKFRNIRNTVLLVFSLIFYGFGGPKYLLLMLCSICIQYICGLWVHYAQSQKIRKIAVCMAVIGNFALLGYFKYMGFFAEILCSLHIPVPVPQIVLPIGISFYTFQGLSYVIDVYRKEAEIQKNPLRLALYIALFPQLVAGPIVRYTTVASEISERNENFADFSDGLVRFLFGLAKKMLLANAMAEIADSIFGAPYTELSVSLAWIGAIAYTFQIYFDFSAYSDMAIGLGRMFGFHFLENFNYPYISKSVTEFWRRWHISLSTWFRDYVYIPLGGNRKGSLKHIFNITVVWFLTGLWHGASWNFILWGMWFCVLLLGEKYIWGKLLERCPRIIRHGSTMFLVIISWVLFRCETLPQVITYIKAMMGMAPDGLWNDKSIYLLVQYRVIFLISFVAALPVKNWLQNQLLQKKENPICQILLSWGPVVCALGLFFLSYMKLQTGSFNPFIYFQF